MHGYPAVGAQLGMVLSALLRPAVGVDVQQITIDWDARIDRAAFEATWRAAAARHPVLRTSFRLDGDNGVVQVVQPHVELPIAWHAADAGGDAALLADRRTGFDLTAAPLLRVTVLASPQGDRVLVTFHHAILDGRSMPLLLDEVFREYAARCRGEAPAHPDRPSYAEFVGWWRGVDPSADETFWKEYLAHAPVPRSLPGHLRGDKPPGAGVRPGASEIGLSPAESDDVRAAARAVGGSTATVATAAWAVLRAAYGGVDEAVFAVTRSCRYGSVPGADDILGMLINTVPLRIPVNLQWTSTELLRSVAGRVREIRDHQLAPLTSILDWAGLGHDSALLDSLLVVERQRLHVALSGLGPEPARATARVHRLPGQPLALYAFDEPVIRLAALWDGWHMLGASAERMLIQLHHAMVELARKPEARLSTLDPGVTAEAPLRAAWNATARPYPRDASVPELFRAQAAARPDATALQYDGERMSYAELDRVTDRLAVALRRRGVGAEDLVAVALPRGAALIRTLLAILKAGAAYLPIDLSSPPARTGAILHDSGARLVIADAGTRAALPPAGHEYAAPVVLGDELAGGADSAEVLPGRIHPLALAYVGYTSGSTGSPKGVTITHRGIVRLVRDPGHTRIGPQETVLHIAPVAFDASTWEIWGALLNGATLVVGPPDPIGLRELADLVRSGRISVAWLTTGLFHHLVEADAAALAGAAQVLTGGDVVQPAALRAALAARGGRSVINAYGPTENTTFTTCFVADGGSRFGDAVPIGGPVPRTTVHVLGPDGRPVPIGVAGELCTGGDGLARGYRNDPASTARSFVPDPQRPGGRLYRTGDLARWRADGVLEFLGRRDDQVKIRGFRVEPGEVTTVLLGHPAVAQAVVVVRGAGTRRRLVGYVTPRDGADPAALRPARLREYVAARLPEYLVPAGFAVLPRLPVNANGKVDRAALPPEEPETGEGDGALTATERRLEPLWRAVLPGVVHIGRKANFFAMGGNSLAAARLMFRVEEAIGGAPALGEFYRDPTLAAVAASIDAATAAVSQDRAPAPPIRRRDRSAYRVAGGGTPEHLVPLAGDWALWRTVCLRAAGFPVELLASLGDPALAAAADDGDDSPPEPYERAFRDAVRRHSRALHDVAGDPTFREAIAWQNPAALHTGVGALLRRGPRPASRDSKHRQHESLVASYLQRYCAKNDTIGFFGPLGWAEFDDGPGIRGALAACPAPVRRRTTYLEGWAVTAVLAPHTDTLRPWLVPRRMPFIDAGELDRGAVRPPLAPPVALTDAQAAVLRACDGVRTARAVAASVPDWNEREVFQTLAALAAARRIAWRVEVAPQDTRPERSMRSWLQTVTDDAVRAKALAALDELCAARDAVAAARGDGVAGAMAELMATFTRLAGTAATRRAGAMYAGRTPVYEECLRDGTARIGMSTLDGARAALALVLDSARWFTEAGAALYAHVFGDIHRRLADGRGVVPFTDFWLRAGELLFEPPASLTGSLVAELNRRWAGVLALPEGARHVRLRSADLAPAVARAFPARRPGWPTAVQHSPDLMLAGDEWVLGELHPGVNTIRYASWLEHHPDSATLRAAMAADLGRAVVYPAESGEFGGAPTRLSNALVGERDLRLVYAHDSIGGDPARALVIGDCDLHGTDSGLRVRRRDARVDLDLMTVLGDAVGTALSQLFRVVAPAPHTPRVTIDSLVVSRESWQFPAAALDFAVITDEAQRYRQARAFLARHGVPRHVFVRCAGERKPVYADLTSLASIDLVSRTIRRARTREDALVSVVEMVPGPDELWLTDPDGRHYAAELRVVAVDRSGGW